MTAIDPVTGVSQSNGLETIAGFVGSVRHKKPAKPLPDPIPLKIEFPTNKRPVVHNLLGK